MNAHVIIKEVIKKYGDLHAIDRVSLDIQKGELFTLLGPSGCGKTTLLRMIAGFNSIEEGTIAFGDKVINNIEAHKRNIGMVFQNYAIFPHMTVFENVAYGLKARKIAAREIEERVKEALSMVQIYELKDRQPANMSGGQQQRVGIARALALNPELLLLDEPTSSLDPELVQEVLKVIRELVEDKVTMIIVTHEINFAKEVANKLIFIDEGRIVEEGDPVEIITNPKEARTAQFLSGI